MNNEDRLREHLQGALDQLLVALALTGGSALEAGVPTDAIDAALGADPAVGIARVTFLEALRSLGNSDARDDRRQAVLTLEEATNALVARSADVGYRLGLRVAEPGLKG